MPKFLDVMLQIIETKWVPCLNGQDIKKDLSVIFEEIRIKQENKKIEEVTVRIEVLTEQINEYQKKLTENIEELKVNLVNKAVIHKEVFGEDLVEEIVCEDTKKDMSEQSDLTIEISSDKEIIINFENIRVEKIRDDMSEEKLKNKEEKEYKKIYSSGEESIYKSVIEKFLKEHPELAAKKDPK